MAKVGKFHNVDFTDLPVTQFDFSSPPDPKGFRCLRSEFVSFWKGDRITREIESSVCHAWYLMHTDGFAGYVTLLADKFKIGEGVQKLLDEGVEYDSFPAVKIGLLAADKRAKGAGKRLVEWSLAYIATELWPKVGIRFVTVDALYDPDSSYDASPYYKKFGFRYANPHDTKPTDVPFNTMYLDILALVEVIEEAKDPSDA